MTTIHRIQGLGNPTPGMFRHDNQPQAPAEVRETSSTTPVVDEAPGGTVEQSASPSGATSSEPDIAATVEAAVAKVMQARDQRMPPTVQAQPETTMEVGAGVFDKRRVMFGHWLQHSAGATAMPADLGIDMAAVKQGTDEDLGLMGMAREFATQRLGRAPNGRSEIFRHSFVSTGDFPLLLEDSMNKRLAAMYAQVTPTWNAVARTTTTNDFRNMDVNFGDATPNLEEVIEGGEVRYEGGTEAQETYRVKTYAKGFRVTRQMVINDDLSFLQRKPNEYARAGITLENRLVWEQVLGNDPVQGAALFSSARNNVGIASGNFALTQTNIGRAISMLKRQKDRNGNTILSLDFATLVVPVELEFMASQILEVAGYSPNNLTGEQGQVPSFIRRLRMVSEPLLDDRSLTNWYLFANPASVDIGELAYLRGSTSPQIMTETTTSIMGVDYKGVHDVGAKIVDYLGTFKNVAA